VHIDYIVMHDIGLV